MGYEADCPMCIGDGYFDGDCDYCEGRITRSELVLRIEEARNKQEESKSASVPGSITWTFNKPTAEGSYLYKQTDESRPMLVDVFMFQPGYSHQTFEKHLRFTVDDKHYPGVGVEMTGSASKWYGPIE